MSTLALFGGQPAIAGPLPQFTRIGTDERKLVNQVLDSGALSGFMGSNTPEFFGGTFVKRLEEMWAKRFGSRFAVSVNSNTSGQMAALGAVGIGPGDEVIVPPMTMSATVVSPLIYGGIPVFADVEPGTCCLDVDKVREAITDRTRAILAVNLYGQAARLHELRALADSRGIYLIEDNAQAILATENGRFTGTIGHIGVFSLNRHKHVQTGEGGICTTDDPNLALRLQMIRNHGENLVDAFKHADLSNMVGMNLRLSEMSAAVGVAQLERVDEIVDERQAQAEFLSRSLKGLDGLQAPTVRAGCRHVFYVWCPLYDAKAVGVSRDLFARAINAEGFPMDQGYCAPLYTLPAFRKRIAIGSGGWPFTLTKRRYEAGMCPVAERMWETDLLEFGNCSFAPDAGQLQQMADAIHKVYENRAALRDHEKKTLDA
jgi:perosamine synthetase